MGRARESPKIEEQAGNSCRRRELWNNLTAPRSVVSCGFFRFRNNCRKTYIRKPEAVSKKTANSRKNRGRCEGWNANPAGL